MSCAPRLATGKGRVDPGATLATTVLLRGPLSILTFCLRQLPLGIVRLRPTTPLCHLAALGLWGITGQFVFLLTIPRVVEMILPVGKNCAHLLVVENPRGVVWKSVERSENVGDVIFVTHTTKINWGKYGSRLR